jgi:hypothetical protein
MMHDIAVCNTPTCMDPRLAVHVDKPCMLTLFKVEWPPVSSGRRHPWLHLNSPPILLLNRTNC